MRLRLLFFLSLSLFQFIGISHAQAPSSILTKRINEVHSVLDHCHRIGILNGQISVRYEDTLILDQTYGYTDGSLATPLNKNAIYSIGSIAKEFDALAIMMLVEAGALELDNTLDQFDLGLPTWAQEVKVRHLLSYTSGLPRIKHETAKTEADVYTNLRNLGQLEFSPGSGYNYNNNNIFLQKRIIERVSEQAYSDFIRTRIIEPLNLKSVVFDPEPEYPRLARAFDNANRNDQILGGVTRGWPYLSNADLHTFLRALHSYELVSKASLITLGKNTFRNRSGSLGNLVLEGEEILGHYHQGSSYNYEGAIYYNPAISLSVVLTTNNKNMRTGAIITAIEKIILGESYQLPTKSVYLSIRQRCYENVEAGIAYYHHLKETQPEKYNFDNPNELNRLGYKLIGKGQVKEAIQVFELMTTEFPEEANAFDSLGEAYLLDGQINRSLVNYRRAHELDPENEEAKKQISKLEASGK